MIFVAGGDEGKGEREEKQGGGNLNLIKREGDGITL